MRSGDSEQSLTKMLSIEFNYSSERMVNRLQRLIDLYYALDDYTIVQRLVHFAENDWTNRLDDCQSFQRFYPDFYTKNQPQINFYQP